MAATKIFDNGARHNEYDEAEVFSRSKIIRKDAKETRVESD